MRTDAGVSKFKNGMGDWMPPNMKTVSLFLNCFPRNSCCGVCGSSSQ